jgi:GGDEF domain-containing protein
VLLPDTNAVMAEQAVERIRLRLVSSDKTPPEFPLSMSFGVATADQRVALTEILKRADERMYEDKSKKRGYLTMGRPQ